MRFPVLLLALLSALSFFYGLGDPAITDSDEAYYAEASREMVESGDYLTPRFNYVERFQKPVFYYWITSAAYQVLGVSEAAARSGAALSGLGLVLLTFACGRRWFDAGTGLLAGAIVATVFGTVGVARMSLPDLPLAFFISLTVYTLLVALFDRPAHRSRWWALAGAAAGLAFLTKGPVGLVIPALVVAPPFFLERGWQHLHLRHLALALALFIAIGVPWYAAMTVEHGTRYLRGFFVGDNLERFATTAYNPHRSVLFYVPIVIGGMLPWSPFLVLGVRPALHQLAGRRWPGRVPTRLLSWSLLPLLLFTVSVGKQPRYILPILPPLGLALARWIRQSIGEEGRMPGRQPTLARILAAVSGSILLLLAVLLWRAQPLLAAVPAGRGTASVIAVALAGIAVCAVAATRRWRLAPAVLAVAGALVVGALNRSVLAEHGPYPVERMARAVIEERTGGEPLGPYRVFVRNLVFYTHIQQEDLFNEDRLYEFLDRPDRVLCVMHEDDLKKVVASGRTGLKRLYTITYFDAATAKLRALLSPDPEREMRRVVLVSNR